MASCIVEAPLDSGVDGEFSTHSVYLCQESLWVGLSDFEFTMNVICERADLVVSMARFFSVSRSLRVLPYRNVILNTRKSNFAMRIDPIHAHVDPAHIPRRCARFQ